MSLLSSLSALALAAQPAVSAAPIVALNPMPAPPDSTSRVAISYDNALGVTVPFAQIGLTKVEQGDIDEFYIDYKFAGPLNMPIFGAEENHLLKSVISIAPYSPEANIASIYPTSNDQITLCRMHDIDALVPGGLSYLDWSGRNFNIKTTFNTGSGRYLFEYTPAVGDAHAGAEYISNEFSGISFHKTNSLLRIDIHESYISPLFAHRYEFETVFFYDSSTDELKPTPTATPVTLYETTTVARIFY